MLHMPWCDDSLHIVAGPVTLSNVVAHDRLHGSVTLKGEVPVSLRVCELYAKFSGCACVSQSF